MTEKFRPMWIGKLDENIDLSWLPENLKNVRPLITGRAIHPIKTFHPNEWPNERVYLEEELAKAAKGWIGTTPTFEHIWDIDGWKVVATEYSDGELKYAIQPKHDNILELVRNGEIKHISIGFDWMVPGGSIKFVNGIAPCGFKPLDLALLKDMPPGDPTSTVKLWEGIAKNLKEQIQTAPYTPPGPPEDTIGKQLEKIERQLNIFKLQLIGIMETMKTLGYDLSTINFQSKTEI